MTAINRLVSKDKPATNDLIPIWDNASGRTRNTSFQGALELLFGNVNPVVDISFSTPNLIVTYYDGTIKNVDIT